MATSTRSPRRSWDAPVPPIFRPLLRAYLIGYASAVGPRFLSLLIQYTLRRQKKERETNGNGKKRKDSFLVALQRVLLRPMETQSFPTFCAALVGGYTFLELPLKSIIDRNGSNISELARKRLSRFLASFISAWMSLQLLQSKQTPDFTGTTPHPHPSKPPVTTHFAGRTLDLTLLAATRALDVIVGELWARRRTRREAAGHWTRWDARIGRLADPALFAFSSGLVMWTWFYEPARLPPAYQRWISTAAAVDNRLITALQRCRDGTLRYGRDTGQAPLLGSMCDDYLWPRHWGDPAVSIPFPCEIVHMGVGPSCEHHALSRFTRSFTWAMTTYLPLSLLLALRSRGPRSLLTSPPALRRVLLSAARSSAFLGAFITFFYYGVCLARTRIGPHIVGTSTPCRQRLDGGICVGTGCFLCGWSILLEHAGRRKDIALFVAPRALATLVPRKYGKEKEWRETAVFATSVAVVLTVFAENRRRVRGVMGGVLNGVF
ncbi:uncharacterized protein C8A04DRAFT_39506 [Dichotomopilus funicola]|uniref:Integral membrane protein n=1 Tax=Dichotomopilus funicola TaxID=1934379 RepID=A0AAN6ZIV5_9PEZI|nr:hypothetical protein C8A04DRAFT_39506 [Dichotomopilus funicola]